MKSRNPGWMMMAVGGMLLWGAGARADFNISYLTSGTFTGGLTSGTPTYTAADGSTTVTYTNTGVQTATVPPESQVSLGSFTTFSPAPSTAPVPVGATFTLDITIISPGPASGHTFVFTGVLNGTVSSTTATGNIVFTPLSESFDGLTFRIASNDSTNGTPVPGAVNLGAPTTNGGTTTLNGAVNVPEPSSVALLCLGGSSFVGLAYRRRRVQAREALAV